MYELVEVNAVGDGMVVGETIGYAIKKSDVYRLGSTLLYREDEKDEVLERISALNYAAKLRNYWPNADDPEVQKLLDDPEFEPVTEDGQVPDRLRVDAACEIVARKRADDATS